MKAQRIITEFFPGSTEELIVNGCSLREVTRKWGTPYYIHDSGIMDKKWRGVESVYTPRFSVHYSVKANPNPHILSGFLSKGAGLEIASGGELYAAYLAGAAPEKIIYAGPGKTSRELEQALRVGIAEIHVESMGELKTIACLALKNGCIAPVSFRVNPGAEAQGGAMQMGGKATSLGIDEGELARCVRYAQTLPQVEVRGVHLYAGTQILDSERLLVQYDHALKIADRVACLLNRPLQSIDFGGGLGVACLAHEQPLDLDRLRTGIKDLLGKIDANPYLSSARLIIEPGRFLVAESGIYVTKVVDIKQSREKTFVITDGGLNHHLAASGNLGQMIKRNFPVVVANRLDEPSTELVDIAGPLCTPMDILARSITIPRVRPGDIIAVLHSGAYARTASPLGFLSHPSPPEILIENGTAHQIRRRGKVEDLFGDVTMFDTRNEERKQVSSGAQGGTRNENTHRAEGAENR